MENTTKNEKVLIKQDNKLFSEIILDLGKYRQSLRTLKTAYEALNIGDFNTEVYKKILISKEGILEKYNQKLNEELDSAGIKFAKLRENMLEGSIDLYEDLCKCLEDLTGCFNKNYPSDGRHQLQLKDISLNEDDFVISDDDKEFILEKYCRIYLKNENEVQLYNHINNLVICYNNLKAIVKQLGFDDELRNSAIIKQQFLRENEEQMEIREEGIAAIISFNERKKSSAERRNINCNILKTKNDYGNHSSPSVSNK